MIDFRKRLGEDVEARLIVQPVSERKKSEDDASPVLEGYAAVFNQWTNIGGRRYGWMESIAAGAFAESLNGDDVLSFFNHDSNIVLGRKSAGTAEFKEDDTGLHSLIYPPDTMHGRDVTTLIKRGDVKGMSFMFQVLEEKWEEPSDEDEMPKRTITKVRLYEAGPVTFPAYEQTSISARDRAKSLLDARAARDGVPSEDVIARRRQAQRIAFEIACEEVSL